MIEDAGPCKIYLDTNVFILAFEGDPEHYSYLKLFFEVLAQRQRTAVTSELTLAEVLAPNQSVHGDDARLFYQNFLIESDFLDPRPVDRSVLLQTAELRKNFRHKLPDAIHIVTGLQAGCRYFVSGDRDGHRLPSQLTHILPDADGISLLMDALRV